MKILLVVFSSLLVFLSTTNFASAQVAYEEVQDILRAQVVDILSEQERPIMGTDATAVVQKIEAKLLEGQNKGRIVEFESDLLRLKQSDKIYLTHVIDIDGREIFILKDVDRGFGMVFLFLTFSVLLIIFSKWQGVRALTSLLLSIVGIVFILLPALLAGYDPMLMSILISAIILALALFGTHGFGPIPSIAYIGTIITVLVTSLIAWFFVYYLRLSGYGDDASVYLNFATRGQLDLAGLLLGSIIIGVLGMLDDIAITQVSVIAELKHANASLNMTELYKRSVRVGKDHIGSLVNTLALAYVGAALPLVLLFSTSDAPLYFTLNQEVVAAEMARILIGSIGLVLTVPITTLIAAWWFHHKGVDNHSSAHYHHHH